MVINTRMGDQHNRRVRRLRRVSEAARASRGPHLTAAILAGCGSTLEHGRKPAACTELAHRHRGTIDPVPNMADSSPPIGHHMPFGFEGPDHPGWRWPIIVSTP